MKKHRNTSIVQITDPEIEEYADRMSLGESGAIRELVQSSDEELDYIDMLSGNIVGQLLKMLIRISGARRVLEIGTFTGYSALMMAEALPEDGELITLEMNIRYQKLAGDHFGKYDKANKITMLKGNAQEIIRELKPEFDLVFLDADKLRYEYYFEHCLPLLRSGGLLVADNVLWDGTVLDPQDHKAEAIDAFNRSVAKDDRVEQVLLPVRDGLNIIRKK